VVEALRAAQDRFVQVAECVDACRHGAEVVGLRVQSLSAPAVMVAKRRASGCV
jgi:hypothetical protein